MADVELISTKRKSRKHAGERERAVVSLLFDTSVGFTCTRRRERELNDVHAHSFGCAGAPQRSVIHLGLERISLIPLLYPRWYPKLHRRLRVRDREGNR